MATQEMRIKLTADAKGAKVGLNTVEQEAKDASRQVQKLDNQLDNLGKNSAEEWLRAAKSAQQYGYELRKLERQEKALEKQQAKTARTAEKRHKSAARPAPAAATSTAATAGLAGMAAGAIPHARAALAAVGGVAAIGAAVHSGAERQAQLAALAAAGADASALSAAAHREGRRSGTSETSYLNAAQRLITAGAKTGDAIAALEGAIVAAAGDQGKLETVIEMMTKAQAIGYAEDDIFGALEDLGVAVRQQMAAARGMHVNDFDSLISNKQISSADLFAGLSAATGEGTAVRERFDAVNNSALGQINKLTAGLERLGDALGSGLVDGFMEVWSSMGGSLPELTDLAYRLGQAVAYLLTPLQLAIGALAGLAKAVDHVAARASSLLGLNYRAYSGRGSALPAATSAHAAPGNLAAGGNLTATPAAATPAAANGGHGWFQSHALGYDQSLVNAAHSTLAGTHLSNVGGGGYRVQSVQFSLRAAADRTAANTDKLVDSTAAILSAVSRGERVAVLA